MIRVLLVDDHPVVRAGYSRLLEQADAIQVVAQAASVQEAYVAFLEHCPDVTISDVSMPGTGGLELLRKIRQRDPDARVLMCSMHDSPTLVRSALEGGAAGFVTKNAPPDNLAQAVLQVMTGERFLSDDLDPALLSEVADDESVLVAQLTLREIEIWRLLALGHTAAECAQLLNLSLKTVANNQTLIREKLGVGTSAALVHLAQRHHIIDRAFS
ncbi:response regulator transcription factor [Limnohabitans sp. Jir72]|uniref:response regulator n=1 Tax=Limnohabitans sp. Jir72 TaxID=1977909 RepID=UPI000D34089D|nr:response regulator transcription factor [Limnohabitans sp. Jir72]PUE33506.1 DNA-binding response regulator [Limnohabitans sp. Jir72]